MNSADACLSWRSPDSQLNRNYLTAQRPLESDGRCPEASVNVEVLWIDDEVRPDDPLLLIMRLDGISAEVVGTGRDGIRLATSRRFDAILLDLRLPDMCGTATLAALMNGGVQDPVVILTGYGDVATCAAALKLGAADFKEKPISDSELVPLILSLRQVHRPRAAPSIPKASSATRPPSLEQHAVAAGLAVLLSDPAIPARSFFALTMAFRRARLDQEPFERESNRRTQTPTLPGVDIERFSTVLTDELKAGRLPRQEELASILAMHGRASWLELRRQTSLSYPTLRTALRVRPTIPALAWGDERISQIAYSIGYEHSAQYTRDFRRVFGTGPRCFRQLVRHGRAAESVKRAANN